MNYYYCCCCCCCCRQLFSSLVHLSELFPRLLFYSFESFVTPALADSFSQEFEWQQGFLVGITTRSGPMAGITIRSGLWLGITTRSVRLARITTRSGLLVQITTKSGRPAGVTTRSGPMAEITTRSGLLIGITARSSRLAGIRWSVCISKSMRILCVSCSRTDCGLWMYHLSTYILISFVGYFKFHYFRYDFLSLKKLILLILWGSLCLVFIYWSAW